MTPVVVKWGFWPGEPWSKKEDQHADITSQFFAEIAGHASSRRYIAFQGVIHHHAIGVEAPAQGPDGALHALDPAAREAVAVAVVVERNHFFAQDAVQIFSIAIVVNAHVGMSSAGSDGESVQAVVGLCPPAVEN